MSETLKLGKYKHYKGNEYIALAIVQHSESCEPMALYAPIAKGAGMWVRPLGMFNETVVIEGVAQPRFTYLGAASNEEITFVKGHFDLFI